MRWKISIRNVSALFWLFAAGLLLYVAWPHRLEILEALANADPVHFFVAFFWYLLALLSATLAWIVLITPFAPGRHWWTHVWIYGITLVSRRLPGTIWYVVGRMSLYKKEGISRTNVTYASSLELVISFSTGILISLVFLPSTLVSQLGGNIPWYAVAGMLLVSLLLVTSPRIIIWLSAKFNRPVPPKLPRLNIAAGLLAYFFMWMASGMFLVQIILAFTPRHNDVTGYIIGTMALSSAMGTLTTFLPSNFGISDVSIALLLSQVFTVTTAGLSALMTRVLGTLFDLFVATFFIPWYQKSRKSMRPPRSM